MTEPAHASLDVRRRKLLFRATHRGTQENDILLGGFVQRHIAEFAESELAAVEALLNLPENELGDWLTGRLPIPAEVATPMLLRVRKEAATRHPLSLCSSGAGEGGAADTRAAPLDRP